MLVITLVVLVNPVLDPVADIPVSSAAAVRLLLTAQQLEFVPVLLGP